ncbi:hypothetical protein L1987_08839 [Smallanthus sonchifolius]|uniref:Uncharacterized protein n=1 Tax=Smallanthus sonchifolius TaxID=185202 RepID=A0ACB9JNF8_9ASTR|nr:hypothetical protein L1987_08839 [Smallanthus sonchifolius]
MGDDRWPKIHPGRTARAKETSDVVNEKIHSAFRNVKSFPLKRIIIQFWRPVKTSGGAGVLSCYGNPYALSPINHRLRKYRSHSVRVHQGSPLVDLALECELTCFMMLPVFYGLFPVGVIEVSTRFPLHLLVIFNELNVRLKRVDLSISHPDTLSRPCEAITGDWRLAQSEIGKALRVAFASHAITHCQVWICYDTYCGRPWRRKLLGRMESYSVFSPVNRLSSVKLFYHDLHCLPWEKGQGLVGKTLETLQPLLCKNIYKLSDNRGLLVVLSTNTKCTTFFQVCSEGTTCDELLVVDVENSSLGSGSTHVKIFPGNKSSDKKGVKRNSSAAVGMKTAIEGQIELTSINNPDDDDLIIFGVYKVDYRLFFLPSSSTFENFMEKINQEFELNPAGTYMIDYQVLPGEWYSLMDGTYLKSYVSSYRASENIDHIKSRVVALEK